MAGTLQVLSLQPFNSSLPPQSIACLATDSFTITLGGTFSSAREGSFSPESALSFRFDQQHLHHKHSTISLRLGDFHIAANGKDSFLWLNQRELQDGEDARLRHGDLLDVGHYNDSHECVEVELSLHVFVTSTPPASVLADALLPTTATTLDHIHSLTMDNARLRDELHLIRQRLHDSRAAAAGHVCVPPSPPRSYGSLLEDLRARVVEDTLSCSQTAPLPVTSYPQCASAPSAPPSVESTSACPSSLATSPSLSVSSPGSSSITVSPSAETSVLRSEVAPSFPASVSTATRPPSTPSSISGTAASSLPTPSAAAAPALASLSSLSEPISTSVLTSALGSKMLPTSTTAAPFLSPSASPEASNFTSHASDMHHSGSYSLASSSASTRPSREATLSSSVSASAVTSSGSSSQLSSSRCSTHPLTSVLTSVLRSDPPPQSVALSQEEDMGGRHSCERDCASGLVTDGSILDDCSPSTSSTGPGSHSCQSLVTALTRIRTQWVRARASLLTQSSTLPLSGSPSSPSSLDTALDRLRTAWIDARAWTATAPTPRRSPSTHTDAHSSASESNLQARHHPQLSSLSLHSARSRFASSTPTMPVTSSTYRTTAASTRQALSQVTSLRLLLTGLCNLIPASPHQSYFDDLPIPPGSLASLPLTSSHTGSPYRSQLSYSRSLVPTS
ncbi:hypothetical protein A4X09_0g7600 [Tilletia walkeri]|uniref:FHA domain-containing protein n=1 Tax=Tilletia walkeri TaxID=117179 RepID=A0A8X7N2Y7_9BASI|nr:hypothetical protein A4X09_0g7600 [Tilletia walkeri]